jgi:hypothetical protein
VGPLALWLSRLLSFTPGCYSVGLCIAMISDLSDESVSGYFAGEKCIEVIKRAGTHGFTCFEYGTANKRHPSAHRDFYARVQRGNSCGAEHFGRLQQNGVYLAAHLNDVLANRAEHPNSE